MSATGSSRQGGFTLIECLAVLAITAAVGALAFPRLEHAMAAVTLAQTKAALVADLQRARAEALRGGAAVALSIDPDGGAYDWTGAPRRAMPPTVRLIDEAGSPIAFFPDGSAVAGRLGLRSGARHTSLTVSPAGVVSPS
jgi:general secretion pathway protein H